MKLENYIHDWNKIEGNKPVNEEEFINLFVIFLRSVNDYDEVTFDGDGAYFGKQIQILKGGQIGRADHDLSFEIAYMPDYKISVYTANHHGFWQPEYLCLAPEHPEFNRVQTELFSAIYKAFGLPNRNTEITETK